MVIHCLSPPKAGTASPQVAPPSVEGKTSQAKSPFFFLRDFDEWLRLLKKNFPSALEASTGSLRNTPGSILPVVQVRPALIVYPNPACLKLDLSLSNCRQPIAIRLGSLGSTAIEGSLAASWRMLAPAASTLT